MSMTLRGPGAVRRRLTQDNSELPSILEFHSPTAALAVTPPLYAARGMVWMVSSLVVACLTASALIPIDKVVTAQGKIVATTATSVVQPLETAIVRAISVHEGDTVHKGELLARLDPTFASADVSALQSQVSSLQAEVDRLKAEAAGTDFHPVNDEPMSVLQGAIFLQRKSERTFKNENYSQKIDSLQTQVQHALSDVYGYSERLKVAEVIESKRRELERLQVGSQLNLLAATDQRLEIKRSLDGAAQQAAQAQRDLEALKAERDAYNQNWQSEVGKDLTDQSRKLSDAQENLKKAELRRKLIELRADGDAIVLNVAKVAPGSVMQSGDQLMTLVPIDAPLEIEVAIPGSEVGYVHPGDRVNLKLETLQYTHYGTIDGTVRFISPDSFSQKQEQQGGRGAPDQGASSPGDVGSLFYRARLNLGESHLHDVPSSFRLMPGMPVVADVMAGKRTVLTYLLARVLPTFMDGMREP